MYIALAVAAGIFLLDRVTKWFALVCCSDQENIINNYLSLQVVYNRGTNWSMFTTEHSVIYALLCGIILLVLLGTAWYSLQNQDRWVRLSGAFVVGGGLSNFVDRLYYPGVIDFIDMHYDVWCWPTFNIADITIVIGVVVLLWRTYRL